MANDIVNKLAYLLGVPETIIQPLLSDGQDLGRIAAAEGAPEIRARCRARQVTLLSSVSSFVSKYGSLLSKDFGFGMKVAYGKLSFLL